MFAYCGNNPIARKDSTGEAWLPAIVGVVALVGTLFLAGCSGRTESGARSELANAPDLDISTAEADSYNCYGNALRKQT